MVPIALAAPSQAAWAARPEGLADRDKEDES